MTPGAAWFLAFVGSVVLANLLVVTVGVIPVGFGLYAPAGVLVVGVAFWIRDHLHRTSGLLAVALALGIGAGISAAFSPALALASAGAFLVSETLDTLIYHALRRRWLLAVVTSNAVGIVADSLVFLSIAFGSLTYLPGQVWAKSVWTLLILVGHGLLAGRSRTSLAR